MAAVKKAQTAFEFLVILSILLFILTVLLSVNFDVLKNHENQVRILKAKDTITELYKASNLVYSEGEGARTKVFIHVPAAVYAASTDNNILEINLTAGGENLSIHRRVGFTVSGGIPTEKGYYWVNVTSKGSSVEISY